MKNFNGISFEDIEKAYKNCMQGYPPIPDEFKMSSITLNKLANIMCLEKQEVTTPASFHGIKITENPYIPNGTIVLLKDSEIVGIINNIGEKDA